MSSAWPIILACLLAQNARPPLDPDAVVDVSKVDQDSQNTPADAALEQAELDALTVRSAGTADPTELEPGGSIRVDLEVPLSRATTQPVMLVIRGSRGGRLNFGPALSAVTVSASAETSPAAPATKRKKRRRAASKGAAHGVARGHYWVRSLDAAAGEIREGANAELVELGTGTVVGRVRLEANVRLASLKTEVDVVRKLEKAVRFYGDRHQEAEASLKKATGAAAPLSPAALQPARLPLPHVALIARALEDDWRKHVALARLRFAAAGSEDAATEAAMLALGRLLPRADLGRVHSQGTPATEISAIADSVRTLELDRAEVLLAGLRRRGDLSRAELARLLALDGAVAAVRGQPEEADRSMGRALCLDPSIGSPDPRPPIRTSFEAVKASGRCQAPLRMEPPEAFVTSNEGEAELHVKVVVGPDPYGVVAGGSVMLFGAGGGVVAERNVRAEGDGQRVLLGVFPDDPELRNIEGVLLVQIIAKDVSGVVLSSVGDPVAMRLPVGEHEDYSEALPWWVWVGGGLLVLAGAGVATLVLLPGDDVRGIGPFDVTF